MADNPTEPVTPTPEPKPEEKEPEIKLDSSKPMRGQVDKLLSQLPPEEKNEPAEPTKEPEEEAPPAPITSTEDDSEIFEEEGSKPVDTVELPPWQKYILDGLPEIQTYGHVGSGKDKLYSVKRAEELPIDFEFSDKRTELSFTAALASQELNARELLGKYNQEQQNNQYQELQNQEALDIQSDIGSLQKAGLLDKFKYSEDDDRFNDDPAVIEANKIYDLYKRTNDKYIKEGRTYRITFADAADKFYAQAARDAAKKANPNAERIKVAEQISAPQGTSPEAKSRPLPPGSSMQDVLKLYKLGKLI